MLKLKVLNRIIESGLVAIVRTDSPDQAARIADACAQGGVAALEDHVHRARRGRRHLRSGQAPQARANHHRRGDSPRSRNRPHRHPLRRAVSGKPRAEPRDRPSRQPLPGPLHAGRRQRRAKSSKPWSAAPTSSRSSPAKPSAPISSRPCEAPLPQASLMPTGGVSIDNVAHLDQGRRRRRRRRRQPDRRSRRPATTSPSPGLAQPLHRSHPRAPGREHEESR